MLPRENRLKKKKDFERVFKEGKGFKEGFLFLKILRNGLGVSRFGFVVGRAFSKKAILRNKIKRRLREQVRAKLPKIRPGFDAALAARSNLETKDFWEMEKLIDRLFKKAKLLING